MSVAKSPLSPVMRRARTYLEIGNLTEPGWTLTGDLAAEIDRLRPEAECEVIFLRLGHYGDWRDTWSGTGGNHGERRAS